MASEFLSEQFNSPAPGVGDGGSLKVLYGTYTFSSITIINDTVKLFVIPKGFTPLFGELVGADLDTGTETLELDVGVTGDLTKYLNSGVITGDTGEPDEKITVGIKLPLQEDLMTVKPTAATADINCLLTVTAAANATGTGVVTVWMAGVFNDPRP